MATRGVTSGHYNYFYPIRAVCSFPHSTSVMLVLQPQKSIEPVGMSRQLHSLEEEREGRGRMVGDARDSVSVTWALCCAHRTGHKAKVNWRENQEVAKFPYHKKFPLLQ